MVNSFCTLLGWLSLEPSSPLGQSNCPGLVSLESSVWWAWGRQQRSISGRQQWSSRRGQHQSGPGSQLATGSWSRHWLLRQHPWCQPRVVYEITWRVIQAQVKYPRERVTSSSADSIKGEVSVGGLHLLEASLMLVDLHFQDRDPVFSCQEFLAENE